MLKRKIGKFGILFASVSGMVGSGWLFGPYYAAQLAGPAAIFSWILGGVLMMFIAMTFAELSSMFPVAGGTAAFTHYSHGSLVSFTMGWCAWISSVVVAPIETQALLQYASNYIPNLAKKIGETHELTFEGVMVAGALMLIMCIINFFGIRFLTRINNFIAVLKLAFPILTAIVFLIVSFNGSNFFQYDFAPYGFKGIISALPLAGVIFSFIGYNPAIQLAAEVHNPKRFIPFAIIGSLVLCILLYLLVQIAFIGSVSSSFITDGWKSLSFTDDNGPFAGMAMSLGLVWLMLLLYFDAVISPFGTALIYTSSAARLNYAMSKNGYFPKFMQHLNKKHVPYISIGLNFVIGMLLFLPFPGWQSMVTFLVSAFVISYAVGPIALVALRQIMPDKKRPFKLPLAYFFSFVAFYICNLMTFWTGWSTVSRILLVILVGYVFLFIYKKTEHGKKIKLKIKRSMWLFFHFIGLGIISYLGSFGDGKNIMIFGWDFLVILLFSLVIFIFAKKSSLHYEKA